MISPNKIQKIGQVSALICALTYIIGFVILITLLAPYGYGTDKIDALAVVQLISKKPHFLIAFNTTIYLLNGIALAILVLVLSDQIRPIAPFISSASKTFGSIWATLVIGAGMIGNVAVVTASHKFAIDPIASAEIWTLMHTIELGLGGGNEIAGGVWFLCVGVGFGLVSQNCLTRSLSILAIIIGAFGLLTIVPIESEITGAVFGIGAIVWFLLIPVELSRPSSLKSRTHVED